MRANTREGWEVDMERYAAARILWGDRIKWSRRHNRWVRDSRPMFSGSHRREPFTNRRYGTFRYGPRASAYAPDSVPRGKHWRRLDRLGIAGMNGISSAERDHDGFDQPMPCPYRKARYVRAYMRAREDWAVSVLHTTVAALDAKAAAWKEDA